jgi:hypothetical protein
MIQSLSMNRPAPDSNITSPKPSTGETLILGPKLPAQVSAGGLSAGPFGVQFIYFSGIKFSFATLQRNRAYTLVNVALSNTGNTHLLLVGLVNFIRKWYHAWEARNAAQLGPHRSSIHPIWGEPSRTGMGTGSKEASSNTGIASREYTAPPWQGRDREGFRHSRAAQGPPISEDSMFREDLGHDRGANHHSGHFQRSATGAYVGNCQSTVQC